MNFSFDHEFHEFHELTDYTQERKAVGRTIKVINNEFHELHEYSPQVAIAARSKFVKSVKFVVKINKWGNLNYFNYSNFFPNS